MRFDPVEFACFDQRRDDRPVLRPCVVTSEECVFAVEGNGADGSLDGVVVEFDLTVIEEEDQPIPVLGDVFKGLPCWGFCRDACAALGAPTLEDADDGF